MNHPEATQQALSSLRGDPFRMRVIGGLLPLGALLLTWETMLAFIGGTKTTTGLAVQAFLHECVYNTGGAVSNAEMQTLNIERHAVCPNWNYTRRPNSSAQPLSQADPTKRELVS